MLTDPRKSIALTLLVLTLTLTGVMMTRKSSTPTTDKTPVVDSSTASKPFDVERELFTNGPKQFDDPTVAVLVLGADLKRIDMTPAEELGVSEAEKNAVMQKYKTAIANARSQLAEK